LALKPTEVSRGYFDEESVPREHSTGRASGHRCGVGVARLDPPGPGAAQ